MRLVQYKVSMKFATPFHVGGGKGNDGIGSYLQRDANGLPYLPGSALKGKVRHYAMLYWRDCTYRLDQQNDDASGYVPCDCIVCKMLGGGGNQRGSLTFSDLTVSSADEKATCHDDFKTEMRMGNAIERSRHTARDNSLFQIETADFSGKYVLAGSICGYLPDDEEEEENSKRLLKEAIRSIEYIGGNTSRGLGWLSEPITITQIQENEVLDESHVVRKGGETSLKLRLTLQTPLLIGGHGSIKNYRSTQQIIPGSVVRAALAREICSQSNCDTDGKKNFVTDKGGNKKYMTLRENFSDLRISACLPKGLRTVPNTGYVRKYAKDSLVYDTLVELLSKQDRSGASSERSSGFYGENGREKKTDTMLITKSAINRATGTVQDEMLYSLELISPNVNDTTDNDAQVIFEGTISGAFDANELRRLTKNGLNIGGKQTSGYGHVLVDVVENDLSKDTVEKLRERIECFNERVSGCEQGTGEVRSDITSVFIPLTLQTDAYVDLPVQSGYWPNDKYMKLFSPLFSSVRNAELCFARAQHSLWRGFDTKEQNNFLKPIRNLIRAGAVFVLRAVELTDGLLEDLLTLQKQGICENDSYFYANNGYGQIVVADSFHNRNVSVCNEEGEDQDMPVTNIQKTYVPELIKAAGKFVDESVSRINPSEIGKRQFTSLIAAGEQACCVEELRLFIQYKKSKSGTEKSWRKLADPLVRIIDNDVRKTAQGIYDIENAKELQSVNGFDEIYLQIVRQFLGYLMWKVHVHISDAERKRPRNGRR